MEVENARYVSDQRFSHLYLCGIPVLLRHGTMHHLLLLVQGVVGFAVTRSSVSVLLMTSLARVLEHLLPIPKSRIIYSPGEVR